MRPADTTAHLGLVLLLLAGCAGDQGKTAVPAPAAAAATPVRTAVAKTMRFADELVVSAEIAAVRVANVGARIPGVLDEIAVDEGDVVTTETVLFRTDRLRLEKALAIAEAQEAVAAASVAARQAEVARFQADLAKAQIDEERFTRLYEQDGAVTKDALENQTSRRRQLEAAVAAARAAVELAEAQAGQAGLAVAVARKDLADSVVRAPFAGVVVERKLETGEIAGAGTTVVRVEDPSLVEITGYLAAVHYDRVAVGETTVRLQLGDVDLGEHVVSFKSPTVASGLRTFAVRCDLADPPAGAVAGRPATMILRFAAREGLGVPADAVLRQRDGTVLYTVTGAVATAVAVTTGLRADDWIELVEPTIAAGATVVIEGQDLLDDGEAVRVVGENGA